MLRLLLPPLHQRLSRHRADDVDGLYHLTQPVEMQANLPNEHLYTPCTQPYFRAPQIYIAMPTRFMDRRGAATDILFMTTRGGNQYDREFTQSFIRPGLSKDGWENRANYAAIGIHQTSDTHLSMFLTGGRRYTLRAGWFRFGGVLLSGGELITKPLTFTGKRLEINYRHQRRWPDTSRTSERQRRTLPGLDARRLRTDLGRPRFLHREPEDRRRRHRMLAGQAVRLRVEMSDADLFSIRFAE